MDALFVSKTEAPEFDNSSGIEPLQVIGHPVREFSTTRCGYKSLEKIGRGLQQMHCLPF
jgi:hypothetical protein